MIERERERGNDRFRLGFGSVFSVWMVRFDGRRWINLDQYFCIYTPNTLNYSYSFGKGKRKKKIYSFSAFARKLSQLAKFRGERIKS